MSREAETSGEVIREIFESNGRRSPMRASQGQGERLEAALARENAAQVERMPDDGAALKQMWDAFDRLRKLGWSEIIYCPKDGTVFDSISAGSTGIHPCHYDGEWPNGHWWVHEAGDLWPARPILWRALSDQAQGQTTEEVGKP